MKVNKFFKQNAFLSSLFKQTGIYFDTHLVFHYYSKIEIRTTINENYKKNTVFWLRIITFKSAPFNY